MAPQQQNPEILFLITARGRSTRLTGKNLRKIDDRTLIAYKAISARKSKYCSRLVISTDDKEMQVEATEHGAEVLFTRPDHLATGTASSDDVVLHAMRHLETEEGRRYDAVMLLEPSTPFATGRDYDMAVEMFLERDANLVISVHPTNVHSIFLGPLGEDGKADKIIDRLVDKDDIRGQALETEYVMSGAFYLIGWDHLKETGKIYSDAENTYALVMNPFQSIEIDTLHDLRLAEFFVENGDIDLSDWQ